MLLACYRQLENRIKEIGDPILIKEALSANTHLPAESPKRKKQPSPSPIPTKVAKIENKKRVACPKAATLPPSAAVKWDRQCGCLLDTCLPSALEEKWRSQVGMPLPVVISDWTDEGGLPSMLAELREQPLYAVAVQELGSCCKSNRYSFSLLLSRYVSELKQVGVSE